LTGVQQNILNRVLTSLASAQLMFMLVSDPRIGVEGANRSLNPATAGMLVDGAERHSASASGPVAG
jgi:hypothetical protein